MKQVYISNEYVHKKMIENEHARKTKKKINESELERIYKVMFRICREANAISDRLLSEGKTNKDCKDAKEKRELNGYILHPEMLEKVNDITKLDLNRGNISATLQYARRQLNSKRIRLEQVIMASPEGLFLPKGLDDPRIFAYSISNLKEINSRARTQNPIFVECMRVDPAAMRKALFAANTDWTTLNGGAKLLER